MNEFTQGASGSLVLDTMCPDVEYWGEDIAGNLETPHNRIHDTVAPVLTVAPTSFCMWPPNHDRFVFRLGTDVMTTVTDVCDSAPTVQIVSVTSNEPDGSGDASFSPSAFCVARTRDGSGDGRVYTVTVQARDYAGNTTNKEVQVLVPHNFTPNCAGGGSPIGDADPCQ